jgi:predicted TIM-barrel fold metal-dependent hydrolase
MDSTGVAAQIAYPNVLGFGGQRGMMVDPDLRLLSTQLYNDAMAEMQAESGERIFPMALTPWWDVKLAMAEIERCHKMGLRGVNTNPEPHSAPGVPDMGDAYWTPFWEMCSDLAMPLNFHIGASDGAMSWWTDGLWPSFNPDQCMAYGSTLLYVSNARVLTNLVLSGFLERFPKLKIVSVESGVGWLPFALESMDWQWKNSGVREEHPEYKLLPSEFFRRQIYGCFWFERDTLPSSIELLGADNIMYETDFPHPTCMYPGPATTAIWPSDYIEQTFGQFPADVTEKILFGTAKKVYNLDD